MKFGSKTAWVLVKLVCEEMKKVDKNKDDHTIKLEVDIKAESIECAEEDGKTQHKRKRKQREFENSTHKELAEANLRLLQQQEKLLEKTENSFSNFAERSDQRYSHLMNMTQQIANDVKIIMMQQQCLISQMQLFMATCNPQLPSNFPVLPAIPTQHFSFSAPPIPQRTTQPAVPPLNNATTKLKPKKKDGWVSYEPSNSE